VKIFAVYYNDVFQMSIERTKKARLAWIRKNVTSTHMGEWYKTTYGYRYDTSIGRYYRFQEVDQ
jgi:hypothetical protein